MMKAMVLALGLAAVLATVVGLTLAPSPSGTPVQAQEPASPAAPANVRAANGAEPGQVVVRWDAVAEAAYYRIGWVNMETFWAVQAEGGREWLDVFDFRDVVNRGQTAQTISNLTPGVEYAFIAASVAHRFGSAGSWSDWTYLTTTATAAALHPVRRIQGTTPDAPGGSGTPDANPGAGGYRYNLYLRPHLPGTCLILHLRPGLRLPPIQGRAAAARWRLRRRLPSGRSGTC